MKELKGDIQKQQRQFPITTKNMNDKAFGFPSAEHGKDDAVSKDSDAQTMDAPSEPYKSNKLPRQNLLNKDEFRKNLNQMYEEETILKYERDLKKHNSNDFIPCLFFKGKS